MTGVICTCNNCKHHDIEFNSCKKTDIVIEQQYCMDFENKQQEMV